MPLDWQGSLHRCSVPGNAPPVLLLCLPARNDTEILQRDAIPGSFLGQHMYTVYGRAASLIPETAPGERAWHRQQGSAQPHLVPHFPKPCTEICTECLSRRAGSQRGCGCSVPPEGRGLEGECTGMDLAVHKIVVSTDREVVKFYLRAVPLSDFTSHVKHCKSWGWKFPVCVLATMNAWEAFLEISLLPSPCETNASFPL